MAIKLTSTKDAAATQGLKILVHGPAGAGKTTLCATADEPTIIISAEGGLLSLRHKDVPVIEVGCYQDVLEAYTYVLSGEGQQYAWVALDSISEIAETVLTAEKAKTKDARQAYGELADQMMVLLRSFRDLPGRNVVMSCKQEYVKDELNGTMLYVPSLPGAKLKQNIAYLFDEVFALRVERDAEGQLSRWLQTSRDIQYECKDRSGALDLFEPPNLAHIKTKITGATPAKVA